VLSLGPTFNVKRVFLGTLICACALLAACTPSGSQAGTVELNSKIGNFPSQPISQGSASDTQSASVEIPAEVFAAGVVATPFPANDASGQQAAEVKSQDSTAPDSPAPSADSQTPPEQSPVSQVAAQAEVAPLVLEPGAAQAVENLASPLDRALAAQALGLIAYDWQNSLKGWELRFLGARTGYRGMTYPNDRRIEVYLRDGDTAQSLAHVVAHEMGHAVDLTFFTDADRRAWISARKVSQSAPWFVASGGSDFASGCGDFAESFAWWQVGPPAWFGELGSPPTTAQLGILVGLVVLPSLPR